MGGFLYWLSLWLMFWWLALLLYRWHRKHQRLLRKIIAHLDPQDPDGEDDDAQ